MSRNLWIDPFEPGEETLSNKIANILANSPGLSVRPEDGRIAPNNRIGVLKTPWIHIRHATTRHCGIWNSIYTGHFNLIPSFCRFHCWKTVTKPPTVKELFDLEDLLTTLQLPSKCGIDLRDYSPGPYSSYIYGDSLQDGRMYYQRMKSAMKAAGVDWPILLKRGCTEMERLKPSDQWDPMTPEEIRLERKLDDIFVKEEGFAEQSEWMKNAVRRRWLRRALEIGDETWKDLIDETYYDGFDGGLFPHVVHYETEEAFKSTLSKPIEELHPDCVERAKERE